VSLVGFSYPSVGELRAELRKVVRRGIDWTFTIAALASTVFQLVGILSHGGSRSTVFALVASLVIVGCGVLGLTGRASWTPVAYVVAIVIGNVAYLAAYGPLVGMGAGYVSVVTLAFIFGMRTWRWVVVVALAVSVIGVGVVSALNDTAPTVDFSSAGTWMRTTIVATAAMVSVAIMIGYCVRQLVVARRTVQSALEAEQAAALEQVKIGAEIARTRRADLIVELAAEVGADSGAALQLIAQHAEVLARELPDDEAQHCLADVVAAAAAAGGTMRSLTVFGDGATTTDACSDAARVVREIPRIVGRLIPKRIAIEIAAGEPAWVPIGGVDLARILSNLVFNARDAIPEVGTIRVTVSSSATTAVIEVRDSGSGMDEETRGKLFQPFFTTKAIGRGTGLGLSTAKILVERAGGSIEVTSERGVGSVFVIELPRVAPTVMNTFDAWPPR